MAMSTFSFWRELGKLIDLPKNCREFTLRCVANDIVTVECVLFPDSGSLETVTKRYRLEEIEDKQ